MEKKRNLRYRTMLLTVVTLLTLGSLSVATAPAAKGNQPTMSCDMGNNGMSCDPSMMTTVTGVLTHHGNVFSIGSITLDYSSSCCTTPDHKDQAIHHALQSLLGETITVTGMLECSQASTLMIFSINDVTYRTMCC